MKNPNSSHMTDIESQGLGETANNGMHPPSSGRKIRTLKSLNIQGAEISKMSEEMS
jgi:hypothetical protein